MWRAGSIGEAGGLLQVTLCEVQQNHSLVNEEDEASLRSYANQYCNTHFVTHGFDYETTVTVLDPTEGCFQNIVHDSTETSFFPIWVYSAIGVSGIAFIISILKLGRYSTRIFPVVLVWFQSSIGLDNDF